MRIHYIPRTCIVGLILVALANPVTMAQTDAPTTRGTTVIASAMHPLSEHASLSTRAELPLLELFTATWCPVCAEAERALERILEEERERDSFAMLAYHPWPDAEDPFGFPEGHQRMTEHYGAVGFPTIWIDGKMELSDSERSVVDVGLEEVYYQEIRNGLSKSSQRASAYEIGTNWSASERNLTIQLDLTALQAPAQPVVARVAFWEDEIRFRGSNGIEDHRMTARALGEPHDVPFLLKGGEWSTEWTLPVPADADPARSGFTVFIESRASEATSDDPDVLMSFAAGTALVSFITVFAVRRKNHVNRLRTRSEVRRDAPQPNKETHDDA